MKAHDHDQDQDKKSAPHDLHQQLQHLEVHLNRALSSLEETRRQLETAWEDAKRLSQITEPKA